MALGKLRKKKAQLEAALEGTMRDHQKRTAWTERLTGKQEGQSPNR